MTQTVAVLEGAIKRYGVVTALDGASFAVRRGETVALLGPERGGKVHLGGEPAGVVAARR